MIFAPLFKTPQELPEELDNSIQIEKVMQTRKDNNIIKHYLKKINEPGAVLSESDKLLIETVEIAREMRHSEFYNEFIADLDRIVLAAAKNDLQITEARLADKLISLKSIHSLGDA